MEQFIQSFGDIEAVRIICDTVGVEPQTIVVLTIAAIIVSVVLKAIERIIFIALTFVVIAGIWFYGYNNQDVSKTAKEVQRVVQTTDLGVVNK